MAGDEATGASQAEGAPAQRPHAQRPLGALDDLPAQEAPTPQDEIPDVSLTLGGASHTVDVAGYFSDSVNGYEVSASPNGIVHTSRSGTVITIEPLTIGTAAVTVKGKKSGGSERKGFTVTVTAMVSAPTATGSIAAATLTEGAGHSVTASDYFDGEGITYAAASSDPGVAAVAVDGAVVTVTAVAAGSATVTVEATNASGSAEQAFAVTVLRPAPVTVGSIAAATLAEGATHVVTASDYFSGEGVTYAAASSDMAVATVAVDGAEVTVTAVAAGSATVTVTATNAAGSAEQSFAVTVVPPAPTAVGSIAAATLTEGASHSVTASGYFDGASIAYAAGSSDMGVATVAVDGAEVTVTAIAAGSATVTVTATNAGGSAEQRFAVTVVPPAPVTVGSIEGVTLAEGATHVVTASDYFDGEGIAYAAGSSDTGVATVAVDGAVVTVTAVAAGSATVTVTATNAAGSAEQRFAVTVVPPAPVTVGSIEGVTLPEGATDSVTASDYFEGEGITYAAASSDTGVVTVAVDGAEVTVTALAAGSATVTVEATNAAGSAEQSLAVTVVPPAPLTVGSIEGVTLDEGATHSVTASDYFDGEGITYAAASSDPGVAAVAVDGAVVTVTAFAAGSATVTVEATNAAGSAEQSLAVTVVPPAPLTVGSIEGVTLPEGATDSVTASDYFEGAGITYAAASSDPGVAAVAVDGAVVTVTAVAAGGATVTVTATSAGGSAEQAFVVAVVPPAPAAVGSIEGVTLTGGATHAVTASDYFSGEGVTYAAGSSDTGVVTVAVDGAVVTVTAVAAGSATVTVTATNAAGSAEQRFAVTVVPPAPVTVGSIEGVTLPEGATDSVTASDYFEGAGITYAAASSDTGVVTVAVDGAAVTVTAVAAGSASVTVTATNAGGSAEQRFAVTVVPPAPLAVGGIEGVTLAEGATHAVTASDYFEGEGVTYAAASSDAEVTTVAVDGAVVTVTAVATGSATVTVTATNAGGSAEQRFAVTVVPPAPVTVGSIEGVTLPEGATDSVTASDYFEGAGITYAAGSSDTGVATVAVDGAEVTVTAIAAGSATVTVEATNAAGSAEQRFAVTVVRPAPVTVGSIAAATLAEGATHVVTASDYFSGEGVTYAAASSDMAVATVAVDGAEVTVTAVAAGSATVTVTATNAAGSAEQSFAVTVVPPAPTAVGSIAAATLTEGASHSVTASGYFSGEGITYAAGTSNTAVATVAVDGAEVTVTAVAAGSATVTVTATNAAGSAEQEFVVAVQLPAVTLMRGGAQTIELSDYFGDEVTGYEVSVTPDGIVHASRSGSQLTFTGLAAGSATVTVEATNAAGSAEQRFAVTVVRPAPVTVGSIAAATITEGATHVVTASDYFEGAGITYAAASSDAGVATVAVGGAAVTVTGLAAGSATVTVEATNAAGSAEQRFAVTVLRPAPVTVGSIAAATLAEGATHVVTASDYFSGEGVTYAAGSSDTGVATVAVDGAVVTVTALAAGSATVTVTATNAAGSAEQEFVVAVQLPAVTLMRGGAQTIELSDYFGDEVTGYEVSVTPDGIVHASRSGSQLTFTGLAAGSATVTVTATSASGSAEQAFAVTVLPLAPVTVGSIAAATLTEGASHSVTASGYFSGEGITYAAGTSNTAVATVAVDGAEVTVTAVAAGSATVTVTATNAAGSAEQRFAVTVLPLAPAPTAVGSIEAATISEGETHSVTASDYFDGEGITYAAASSDPGVAAVAVDGAVVTVTAVAAGGATVTVTATSAGGSAEQAFVVAVVPPAPAAVGSIEGVTLTGGATHAVTASDYFSGASITYTAASSDAGVATVAVGGAAVTVTGLAAGSATVTVTATNASGSAEQRFAVTVVPPAPVTVGSIEGVTLPEGATDSVTASDYFEGAGITYAAASSDTGVVTVAVDGAAVTVTAVAAGSASVTVTATNAGGSAEQRFAVTVVPPAPAAVGSIEAATITEGATHVVTASDYFDGEGITYAAASSDPGVAAVAVDGAVVTVTAVAAGGATVTVTATSAGGSAEQAFAVTVLPLAPVTVGSIEGVTLPEGATDSVTASDYFSGEGITYAAGSSDTGVATVAVDGAEVTVTAIAAGSATVTVEATNAAGSAEQRFAVTVVRPAPVTVGSIAAATLAEGATHVVTASDYFSGEGVTYAAASSDTGVATVAVDGAEVTVTAVATGSATVTVTATNAGGSAEQRFAVTVVPPAPVTVGSIEGVTLAEGATHVVTASDYFDGEGIAYAAGSSDTGVATVAVDGAVVTVTAVAAGGATVTVTATNVAGSAEQSFAVAVLRPAPAAVGSIEAATLTEGASHSVTASDYFSGEGITYAAASSDTGVATVAVDGADVTVTAVAAGGATVTVEATNASGSAEQAFAVIVRPRPPAETGAIPAMVLDENGAALGVELGDYFGGEVARYRVSATPGGIVHLWESSGRLTITPLAAGEATVTVTATNPGGSAEQAFTVTVRQHAPRALGAVPLVTLREGDRDVVDVSDYFAGEGLTYTAESPNADVATVALHGAAVVVTARGVGLARVAVTATNGSGSAEQEFMVLVSPRAPKTVGGILDVTLTAGGAARRIDLPDHFRGAFIRYGATATPGGVVHLWESGGRLTLTPLAAGAATVTVWAANSSGSATQTFEVVVKQRAPKALAGSMPLRLTEGGAPHEIDLADYFGGAVAWYEATAVPNGVVHLWESGGRLRLTPLAAGIATVTVTATNDSGSSGQVLAATVGPAAPRALGSIADVTLTEGGEAREMELADYFDGAIVSYDVAAVPGGTVHLWESGGRLRLAPLAAGVASVTVTAANASGSAEHVFAVTVVPAAPGALGGIEGVTLIEGVEARELELADHFGGTVVRYELTSVPDGGVHLWESGGRLRLTPLAAGLATVTVTATNAVGSVEQSFGVAVAPAAPRALGGIADVTLTEGGEALTVELSDYFGRAVDRYEVSADSVGVVHLWASGGRLTLTPLAPGVATVTVTALNGSGSGEQQFAVSVEPAAAAP